MRESKIVQEGKESVTHHREPELNSEHREVVNFFFKNLDNHFSEDKRPQEKTNGGWHNVTRVTQHDTLETL